MKHELSRGKTEGEAEERLVGAKELHKHVQSIAMPIDAVAEPFFRVDVRLEITPTLINTER